jgi:hypothetical protein
MVIAVGSVSIIFCLICLIISGRRITTIFFAQLAKIERNSESTKKMEIILYLCTHNERKY